MSKKFDKYLPKNDNSNDGGFRDDRFVRNFLYDDRDFYMHPIEEKQYREEHNIPDDVAIKDFIFSASVSGERLRYDKNTNTYYFIAKVVGKRCSSKSTIHVMIQSDIFYNKFDEIIELPTKIKSSQGVVRIIIPTKRISNDEEYEIVIEYKDEKDFAYHKNIKKYFPLEDQYIDFGVGIQNMDDEYDIKYDNTKTLIEYGYEDAVHGLKFVPIEGIEAYQKEDGTWTSIAVDEPEKYLKSDLEWYYSDEREIQYLVNKGIFTEEQANAIRAANYEDIFSFEYKMKSAIKIIPIVLVMIIIAIIVIKKIRKRIF